MRCQGGRPRNFPPGGAASGQFGGLGRLVDYYGVVTECGGGYSGSGADYSRGR